ncbi:hypothetical protein MJO28_010581 [Puccinia striiformis f. sp. tritici]|uniref:Uncharacterized protein n=1 Tax=Puccinia striiformis f. sp. tritici TaxID=168172 RepID=A0ACC0E6B7_9BASI|nr:hypothetical protein MJO28_010581 [Puccinia striiformis f. sp. tritici]
MTEVDPSAVGEVRSRQYGAYKFHETLVFLRLWAHHHMKYHFVVFILAVARIPMELMRSDERTSSTKMLTTA